ncbi:hypothetical protein TIFTF001_016847 [Ficus carica]|uniref:Gag protein n=1 Tax=Ficus carica TaxID=3494 RepID=A0AA88ATS6_FICCA|nr:hypothetical protein TIFTF001_016847 [Ficus carica]
MVRPRTRANPNPQDSNLANIVATLQQQLLEQQQETNRLREQIAQLNQMPRANFVPPQENPVPPVVPQVPEVHQEIPRNAEVPLAPVGIQTNPPWVREDLLYKRLRRMKAPEFEGTADPIEADNWLMDVQLILDFMRLSEQEKVLCASFVLKKDARERGSPGVASGGGPGWGGPGKRERGGGRVPRGGTSGGSEGWGGRPGVGGRRAGWGPGVGGPGWGRERGEDEFNSFRQGSMTVMEAVKMFEQLARLCPELVPNETEKVRRMMKMFRTDIAKQVSVDSNPPTLVSDCISGVIRAEYWINQDREARAQIFKARKEEKAIVKHPQPR